MDKLYLDRTEIPGNTVLIVSNAEIINTGTTLYSMPVSCKNAEYERYAKEYDIHFLFDDSLPHPNFYTVPQADIFATDSKGGYWCSIGETFDREQAVYYIDGNHNCYLAMESAAHFIAVPEARYETLIPYTGIEFFQTREEANAKYDLFGSEALQNLKKQAIRET